MTVQPSAEVPWPVETPLEQWLTDQAGVSELPAVIPDWVLEQTPMAELLDRLASCSCSCDCGAAGCASDVPVPDALVPDALVPDATPV